MTRISTTVLLATAIMLWMAPASADTVCTTDAYGTTTCRDDMGGNRVVCRPIPGGGQRCFND